MSHRNIGQNDEKGGGGSTRRTDSGDLEPEFITDGYSLEISARYVNKLREAAPRIPEHTPIAVTYLPGETLEARLHFCPFGGLTRTVEWIEEYNAAH